MAMCEVLGHTSGPPMDEVSHAPRIHAVFNEFLPHNFYSYQKSSKILRQGGPIRSLGGLINIGYNCYMNSVLQCLAYTPGFSQICLSLPNVLYQMNDSRPFFLDSFGQLFTKILSSRSACPSCFLQDSWSLSESFRRPIQQDAHEYLLKLINRFENECSVGFSREDEPTIISHFFSGESRATVTCSECGHSTEAISTFHDIAIPIHEYPTAEEAVEAVTSPHVLPSSEKCPFCNSECNVIKTNSIIRFPLVLVITMMRFDSNLRKLDDFLPFPDTLTFNNGEVSYQLYGMIIHEGRQISHGHFIAIVRDRNKVWYKADDVVVYRMIDDIVMSSSPYVLFYHKTE